MGEKNTAGGDNAALQDSRLAHTVKKEELAAMLRGSCDRLQATLDALPDLMFVVDREGKIFDYHVPGTGQLFADPEKFLGRNVGDILPEPAAGILCRAIEEAAERGHHHGGVYSLPTPAGDRWFELSISAHDSMQAPSGRLVVIARDITEIRRAEDALRESEASKRALADNLQTAMIYQIDSGANGQQRRFTYISQGVERLHGITPEEAAEDPQRIYGQVVEEDRALVVSQELRALETMTPLNVQVRIRMPSGEIRWRVFTSNPRRLPNGHVVWDGIEYDITERRRAEEALRESEFLNRAISDNLPDGMIYRIDSGKEGTDPRYTYVSQGVERLHGFTAEHLMTDAQLVYRQILEEDRARVAAMEARAFKELSPFSAEVRVRLPSGQVRWRLFISSPRRLENGHVIWDGIELDVTEQKQSEEALRKSERQNRLLLASMHDAYFLVDLDKHIMDVNSALEILTGYTRKELLDLTSRDLIAPRWHSYMQQARDEQLMKRGYSDELQVEVVRKDGSLVPVEIRGSLVRGEAGEPVGILTMICDITQRKRAEEALQQSEAKYRQLYENMQDAFVISGTDGRLMECNSAFEKMLGYSRAELMHVRYQDLTPEK